MVIEVPFELGQRVWVVYREAITKKEVERRYDHLGIGETVHTVTVGYRWVIDFWKLCIIKQENTQDNKQDEMLRGEKLWQIILHRLRLQTQCWIALHLYRRKSEK